MSVPFYTRGEKKIVESVINEFEVERGQLDIAFTSVEQAISDGGAKIKTGTFTIGAAGPLAITGVGFQPDVISIIGGDDGMMGAAASVGQGDVASMQAVSISPNTGQTSGGAIINAQTRLTAVLTSMDADGFTLDVVFYTSALPGVWTFQYVAMKSG